MDALANGRMEECPIHGSMDMLGGHRLSAALATGSRLSKCHQDERCEGRTEPKFGQVATVGAQV